MPRRNRTPRHTKYAYHDHEAGKRRFPSKQAAENAAEIAMLQHPTVELSVYQGLDGGWYLTSKQRDN